MTGRSLLDTLVLVMKRAWLHAGIVMLFVAGCGGEKMPEPTAPLAGPAPTNEPTEGPAPAPAATPKAVARKGNVGPNKTGHIIDRYVVPCPEGPKEVFADLYGCPPGVDPYAQPPPSTAKPPPGSKI